MCAVVLVRACYFCIRLLNINNKYQQRTQKKNHPPPPTPKKNPNTTNRNAVAARGGGGGSGAFLGGHVPLSSQTWPLPSATLRPRWTLVARAREESASCARPFRIDMRLWLSWYLPPAYLNPVYTVTSVDRLTLQYSTILYPSRQTTVL